MGLVESVMRAFCIYGPPGTGKTSELIRLINETIDRNAANSIVFLSHTKVAAQEAVSRGSCRLPRENAMTLHSLCFRLNNMQRTQVVTRQKLVAFGEEVGMPITGESPDSERDLTDADFMMAIYDVARNRMQAPEEAYELSDKPGTPVEFKYLIRSYEDWKQNTGHMDFVDMLLATLQIRRLPHYKAFFIDEAQDLSNLQRQVLYKITGNAALVFMAGDDDQCIFSWAGAEPHGMPEFEERFQAQRKVLNQSHRIPRSVHVLAESVIRQVQARVEKEYKPRDEEGVLERIAAPELIDYSQGLTFLYRDRSVRAPVEEMLQQALIPYHTKVGFPSPLDNKAGRAVHALRERLRGGEHTSMFDEQYTALGRDAMQRGKSSGEPWSRLVQISSRHSWYLDNVNWDAPPVTLSSIHSFKGAESEHIVLSTGMAVRTYSAMATDPDSEARVFYVGVTRARQKLTIVEGQNGFDL